MHQRSSVSFSIVDSRLPADYARSIRPIADWALKENLWDSSREGFRDDLSRPLSLLELALLRLQRDLNRELPEARFGEVRITSVQIRLADSLPEIHQDGVLKNGKPMRGEYLRATLDLTHGGSWVGTENRYSSIKEMWQFYLGKVPVLGGIVNKLQYEFGKRRAQRIFEEAVEQGYLFQVGRGNFFVFSRSWRPVLLEQLFPEDAIHTRNVEHSADRRENGVVVVIGFDFFPYSNS